MPRTDEQDRKEEKEHQIRRRQFRFQGFVVGFLILVTIILIVVFALSYLLR
jgi:hypothetical protein